jgi:hypothetical protein
MAAMAVVANRRCRNSSPGDRRPMMKAARSGIPVANGSE